MKIYYSHFFETTGRTYFGNTQINHTELDIDYFGTDSLISFLEARIGLSGKTNNSYTRLINYQEALEVNKVNSFYENSFERDKLKVSKQLLDVRDELLFNGWNPETKGATIRLSDLSKVELSFTASEGYKGIADRASEILKNINLLTLLKNVEIVTLEKIKQLPYLIKEILSKIDCVTIYKTEVNGDSDLNKFQNYLSGNIKKVTLKGDNSLNVIYTNSDLEQDYLIYSSKRISSETLICTQNTFSFGAVGAGNGLHDIDTRISSKHIPALQLFHLVTAPYEYPLSPVKLLSYLTLPLIPIRKKYCYKLARCVKKNPGIWGETWNEIIEELIEDKTAINKQKTLSEIEIWFPKSTNENLNVQDIIKLYNKLAKWAAKTSGWVTESELANVLQTIKNASLDLVQLIETLAEDSITSQQLNNYRSAILEETIVQFSKAQVESIETCNSLSNIAVSIDEVYLLNFIDNKTKSTLGGFLKSDEIEWLTKRNQLNPNFKKNETFLKRDMIVNRLGMIKDSLTLIIPQIVAGKISHENELISELKLFAENPDTITLNEANEVREFFLSQYTEINPASLPKKSEYWNIDKSIQIDKPQRFSSTSIKLLIDHPHQWILKYACNISSEDMLVINENFVIGNLAERFACEMLSENIKKKDINNFIDNRQKIILKEQAAFFNETHRGEDKELFLSNIKRALQKLHDFVAINKLAPPTHSGIKMFQSKLSSKRNSNIDLFGFSDLIMMKGDIPVVIDFKYTSSSKNRYENDMKEGKDIQLILYYEMLKYKLQAEHVLSAYFMLNNGNCYCIESDSNLLFGTIPVQVGNVESSNAKDIQNELMQKMENTIQFRFEEFNTDKKIEVDLGEEFPNSSYYVSLANLFIPKSHLKGRGNNKHMIRVPDKYDSYKLMLGEHE